jgi:hypothetical protein
MPVKVWRWRRSSCLSNLETVNKVSTGGSFSGSPIRLRLLFFGILVSCAFAGGLCHECQAPPLIKDLSATTRGQFVQFSESPKKIFGVSGDVRRWVSRNGDDSTVGTIRLGPFLAPQLLHFWAAGYPKHNGNELYVENANTHERRPIDAKSEVGTHWQLIGFGIPEQWVGTPIFLIAQGAGGTSSWIGLSEPVFGGANEQLLSALTGFSVNGLLLGLLWCAALRRLSIDPPMPECWLPLIAAATVSALGYMAFWAYLANPVLGEFYSCAIISLACVDLLWNRGVDTSGSSDAIAAAKMGLQWRRWCAVIVVFLAIAGPWIAFQKFYAPPGNRLIKWHLAGQIDIDPRGSWQTLKDSYSKSSWDQLVAARASNFRIQSPGSLPWSQLNGETTTTTTHINDELTVKQSERPQEMVFEFPDCHEVTTDCLSKCIIAGKSGPQFVHVISVGFGVVDICH